MKSNKNTSTKLKLYKLYSGGQGGYDTYDSCVVAAWTEEQARYIHPNENNPYGNDDWWKPDRFGDVWSARTWCLPEEVVVEYVGDAAENIKPGEVVCASFNAG